MNPSNKPSAHPTDAFPHKGDFYRHYKADPAKDQHDHMYEIVGIALGSEDKQFYVLYRPVYANTWLAPADVMSRPLDMFFETVEKDGKTLPRFAHITDAALIAELREARSTMYPRSM